MQTNSKWKYLEKLLKHLSVKIMNKIVKMDIKLNLIIFKNKKRNKLSFSKSYLKLKSNFL